MEVRDQLLRLVRLQEVLREIRAANDLVNAAPHRKEEIENRFRERNAEYVAVQQRADALATDQSTRSVELATLEESRKKYMDDLMGVQNQREYAAMLKEIDSVKSRIAEHEDAILKDMEEIESVKEELATHADHISAERELVKKECAEVEAASVDARQATPTKPLPLCRWHAPLVRPLLEIPQESQWKHLRPSQNQHSSAISNARNE